MASIYSGTDKTIIFGIETVNGTKAANNVGKSKTRVKFEPSIDRDKFLSARITDSAQISNQRTGTNKITATLSDEMSCGNSADEYANLFRGAWAAGATASSAVVAANSVGNKLTRSAGDWIALGFRVGDPITITGFTAPATANNMSTIVLSVTAVDMVVADTLITKAAGDTVVTTVVGKKLVIPRAQSARTKSAFTAEQVFNGTTVISEIWLGLQINSAKMEAKPTGMATVEFDIIGRSKDPIDGTAQYFVAPTAAPTTDTLTGAASWLYLNGVKASIVTSLSLDIAGDLTTGEVLSSKDTPDIFQGNITAGGSFSSYFVDNSLMEKFLNEEEFSITFQMLGKAGTERFTITLPRIKLSAVKKSDEATGGMMLECEFDALLPLSTSTSQNESTVVLVDSTL